MHIFHAGHLIGCGCIACHIDRAAVGKGEHITHAFIHIVEAVEACLNRFHAHIRQIEYLMHAVDERFFVRDNIAILISIGYFVNGTMIEVPVGHQDQIGRQPVLISGIGMIVYYAWL